MKINPKIAKSPDELKNLEFKKMKVLIKKELKRLEKYSSATEPTPFLILGEFDYVDKPAMALPIFGVWKGKFKEYAKKEVVKDKLGAIGTAYYGGMEESGQKKVFLNLAKGLGKNKSGKLERTLKKLIPQATYNVIFSEIDETVLDNLEAQLENAPEIEENFDETEIETPVIDSDQDVKKLLIYNFKKIIDAFKPVKEELIPRFKTGNQTESDIDTITDLVSLADEWLQIYNSAGTEIQGLFQNQNSQINLLKKNLSTLISKLSSKITPDLFDFNFINNVMTADEKPDARFEIGLSSEGLKSIFVQQGLDNNCDAAARMIVYNYLSKKGILEFNNEKFAKRNNYQPKLMMQATELNQFVESKDYEIDWIYDGTNSGHIQICTEENGKFIKDFAYEKAIKYIDANLTNGIPVIAGIGIPGKIGKNPGSTDHFITIVGKNSKGYFYLDPAANGEILDNNLLELAEGSDFMFKDPNMEWTRGYNAGGLVVLTTVAVYPKDKEGLKNMPGNSVMEVEGTVKKNSGSANDIKIVQFLLQKAGYDIGLSGVDGDCGDNTYSAIVKFQTENGIQPANGIVEPNSPTFLALKGKTMPAINPEEIILSYDGSIQKITPDREQKLKTLLAASGEKEAVIINTYRSENEQAAVMYANIKAFGPELNKKQYKNPEAATKVVDAYQNALNEGVTDESKLKAVLLTEIQKVGAQLLSGHCDSSNPAVDILPSSIKDKSRFIKALNSSGLFSKLVAPPKDSSFHLEFK